MYGQEINATKSLWDLETFQNETVASFNETIQLENSTDASSIVSIKGVHKIELVYFITVSVLGFVLNLRAMKVSANAPSGINREFNVLAAHLSSVTLVSIVLTTLLIVNRLEFISISYPVVCEVLDYLQKAFSAAFALNITCIMFERVKTFRDPMELFCAGKVIRYNWIVALIASIPSFLTVEYYEDPLTHTGSCKQVPLVGLIEATITYESTWFWGFHFLIVGHVGYALFKICEKFRFPRTFKPISNENMRQDVHQIWFGYITGINFIALWIPIGFLLFLHSVLSRHGYVPDFSLLLRCALHLQSFYYLVNPLLYLYLMAHGSVFNMFCCQPNIPVNNAVCTDIFVAPAMIDTEIPDELEPNVAGCSTTNPMQDSVAQSNTDEDEAKKKSFPNEKRFPGWRKHNKMKRYRQPSELLAASSFSTILAVTDSSVAFAFQQTDTGCYNLVYPQETITAADLERLSLQRGSETLI